VSPQCEQNSVHRQSSFFRCSTTLPGLEFSSGSLNYGRAIPSFPFSFCGNNRFRSVQLCFCASARLCQSICHFDRPTQTQTHRCTSQSTYAQLTHITDARTHRHCHQKAQIRKRANIEAHTNGEWQRTHLKQIDAHILRRASQIL
jgi:hypothetical protein